MISLMKILFPCSKVSICLIDINITIMMWGPQPVARGPSSGFRVHGTMVWAEIGVMSRKAQVAGMQTVESQNSGQRKHGAKRRKRQKDTAE